MVHYFDHRFGTYEGQTESQANQSKLPELDEAQHADPCRVIQPWYWVPSEDVKNDCTGSGADNGSSVGEISAVTRTLGLSSRASSRYAALATRFLSHSLKLKTRD